jgi:transcriptional regulator with XRE-family HTH domain
MKNTRELLAAVKQLHGLTSDYQLAKFLNVSKQRVSKYQSGEVTLGDDAAIIVADALQIERGRVLAIVAAERAQSDQAKKEWLKLAAVVAAVSFVALLAPDQLALLPASFDTISAAPSLYIMSTVAALLAALRYQVTRRALAILALVSLPAQARAAADWDSDERALAVVAVAATVADWGQTLYIAENPQLNYYEKNPFLGDHPSRAQVNRYFAGALVGGAILAHQLPPRWRKLFLGTVAVLEVRTVAGNFHAGIKISF